MNFKLLLCKLGLHRYERKTNFIPSEMPEGLQEALKDHLNIPKDAPDIKGKFRKAVSVTYRCIICEKIKIEKYEGSCDEY